MTLALGCIADDYTGASDLANTLTRCGLRTVQTIGVPADDLALPEVDAVVVSLKSRSIEAGLAVSRSREAEKWLRGRGADHVLFKICSTFDSTDAGNIGPVMDALRADSGETDRAGDAGISGDRPHGLSWAICSSGSVPLNESPLEGSSAQPDARFQPGAGAGAPEQDQGRAGRSRRHRARRPMPSARVSPSSPKKASAPPSRTRCSSAISRPSARSRWIIASPSAHPASGSGSPARWSPPAGSNRMRRTRSPTLRSADRRRASPAVVRRRRCSRSPTPKPRCRCCISIPSRSSRARTRRGARSPGPGIGSRQGPVLIASSSTPDQVAALQARHGRDAAGHAIEQAMADIAEGLVAGRGAAAGGRRRRNLRRGGGSPGDSRLSGGRGNRRRRAGAARRRRKGRRRCCWR